MIHFTSSSLRCYVSNPTAAPLLMSIVTQTNKYKFCPPAVVLLWL